VQRTWYGCSASKTIETSYKNMTILASCVGYTHMDDKENISIKYWNGSFSTLKSNKNTIYPHSNHMIQNRIKNNL
jgi:hypothetical protein